MIEQESIKPGACAAPSAFERWTYAVSVLVLWLPNASTAFLPGLDTFLLNVERSEIAPLTRNHAAPLLL
jgi:hypothetical protein